MVVTTAAAANIVKGGVLLFSCCNRGPPRPLLSTCSFAHSLFRASTKIIAARGGRLSLAPPFCTAADAAATAESSSAAAAAVSSDPIRDAANMLDIRVGRILRAWRHEEADSLYVEEVDVGEPEPRIICSGLVNFIPLDHLQIFRKNPTDQLIFEVGNWIDENEAEKRLSEWTGALMTDVDPIFSKGKKVVVLANLKPRNMRGVKSCGMLMAASDSSHENVELLVPPEGSLPGERIWFGSEEEKENQPDAATPNQIQKKKIWEVVQPHLKTDASCAAVLEGHFMRTSAGVVVCRSLKNANIS